MLKKEIEQRRRELYLEIKQLQKQRDRVRIDLFDEEAAFEIEKEINHLFNVYNKLPSSKNPNKIAC